MERPGSGPGAGAGAQLRLPPALARLRDERVDVVGVASVEAGEMARYLLAAGFPNVVGHDRQPDRDALAHAHSLAHAGLSREERAERLQQLLGGLSELHLGGRYLEGVEGSALVIATQAWFLSPANAPLHRLRERGHPFYSLAQAYLDLAQGEVVGVTGSHGKSTTTWLAAELLRASGRYHTVWLAGNDRHNRQALEEVARDRGGGCLVLEISNRQLLQLERAPRIGAITNITPNHLDEHGGMEGYVRAKRRIFDLPGCQLAVRNGDDPVSLGTGELGPGTRELRFARNLEQLGARDGCYQEGERIMLRCGERSLPVMEAARVPLLGEHNLANLRCALALLAAAVPPDPALLAGAAAAVERFTPLRHRTQLVQVSDGVEYVDDLSSTTPQSTVAALRALHRPSVLIAGGDDKGIDFSQLATLEGDPLRAVVLLPGAGSEQLAQALRAAGRGALVHRSERLLEAVRLARGLALPGDAVLLSPACPGFFSAHYGEGGFRQAVRRATSPRPRTAPA